MSKVILKKIIEMQKDRYKDLYEGDFKGKYLDMFDRDKDSGDSREKEGNKKVVLTRVRVRAKGLSVTNGHLSV